MTYIVVTYAVVSLVTFVAYGIDKRAATRGRRRVPETTVHLLELFGGFLGALAAQRVFRHKTRKARFVTVLWLIALLHAAAWAAWLMRR